MRRRKLKYCVSLQGALKQKSLKKRAMCNLTLEIQEYYYPKESHQKTPKLF